MNIEKLTKEIGSMDSAFIDEALEYQAGQRRRAVTMRRRKTAFLIAAAVLMLVVSSCAVAKEMLNPHNSYYGSLEDGTAVVAPSDSVKLSAEKIDGISVKFVVDEDESVYPFNEYTELVITGFTLYNGISPFPYFSSNGKPDPDQFGESWGAFGSSEEDHLSFKNVIDGREMYLIKKHSGGKYAKVRKYTLQINVLYGRNAVGELMEIRGDWKVDFEL